MTEVQAAEETVFLTILIRESHAHELSRENWEFDTHGSDMYVHQSQADEYWLNAASGEGARSSVIDAIDPLRRTVAWSLSELIRKSTSPPQGIGLFYDIVHTESFTRASLVAESWDPFTEESAVVQHVVDLGTQALSFQLADQSQELRTLLQRHLDVVSSETTKAVRCKIDLGVQEPEQGYSLAKVTISTWDGEVPPDGL